jgi:hypothetical protein
MHQMTMVVLPARPQSRDPACLAVLPPKHRVDPVVGIERCDDDIGDVGVALGVAGLACEFDPDPAKPRRKGCIQDRPGTGV